MKDRFKPDRDRTEMGETRFCLRDVAVPGLAAEEMATRFRWIGIDMAALRDNEDMRMQSVFFKPA